MCGITGFISIKWGSDELHSMTRRLQHRGPDAEGFYINESVHLGHRRLSILDLSVAANQPFFSKDKRYVMVFNGEVFNYKELAVKYAIPTDTTSDTEVILELFALQGPAAFQEFNGMFAIAIWDTYEKKLTLLRDRFGIKPVCYYDGPDGFGFASEIKSLLELPIPRLINSEALADYLFLEYIPKPNTIFQNIKKLTNGCYLEVTDGVRVAVKAFYDIREKYDPKPLKEKEGLEEFHHLLSDAVKSRMISDVPIGAFLSGGVDSSLVVSKFQENSTLPVETFTIGFDEKQYDESAYAKKVSELLKTNHHEYRLPAEDVFSVLKDAIEFYDEPFAVSSVLPSLLISKVSRQHTTVALTGDGADELFMGYNTYYWYNRIETLKRIGGKASLKLAGNIFKMFGGKPAIKSRLFEGWADKHPYINLWSQEQQMFTQQEIGKLLNYRYTHETTIPYWESLEKISLNNEQAVSFFDIQHYLADDLMYKMDIASMRHGLEVRCPFLDYNLVEFAVNLPLELKINNGTQKYILKKALEKYIPQSLIYRTKWGFSAPSEEWLKRSHTYLIDHYLDPARISAQGIFNAQEIQKLIASFRSGHYYHGKRLWSLVIFQLWYEQYMVAK
ncbi:asparagine synthase (glutamine-hydrolyzing) [Cytophaga hutchinsonii]|uniref:asparagine synthase (glutamine-hydrolyzing) n=1 Tax=Cytophaga hutchinsonii (strain ATCC 33406 / DSM 1761 / CIP 103989 / NBRC 15051 / NCIMB 9469 / D465) TaxID=269798 RepID=A0A6N4SWB8_CYTH3|nr:asparagine synthase (glutamine-hydrolyzing) [Cytophaga hutchinsonii]ABG60840.1 asparagine synthase, glutamine-hydrolyzing [Cytophaga hutchinsonii ATCC 33406]SFX72957.1 asparagine synthase (glutamine-hydrolysing) [Cytophaga hutchinsonii ATCC 33406]